MRASRQSNRPCAPWRAQHRRSAFTLIELIFVLALLAISAAFVASHMSEFFRGRALNYEARRLLSLTHFGQSRAVSEGVPVLLWINPKDSTYGLSVPSSYAENDAHAASFTIDPSLTLETPTTEVTAESESGDEKLGLPDGLLAIRFNPDGFFDESSLRKIVIRQGTDAALELGQTANRLGYEIRPATLN